MSDAVAQLGDALLGAQTPAATSPDEAAARTVYDHPSNAWAAPQPSPTPAAQVPDAEQAERTAQLAKLATQSDAMPYGSEVGVALGRAAENLGLVGDEAQAVISEIDGAFKAHGISGDDALGVIPLVMRALDEGPPDAATEAQWVAGIDDRLSSAFGSQLAANEAADVARQWVQRDPALVQFLDDTGLGNHPSVIVAVARAAMNARRAGKF